VSVSEACEHIGQQGDGSPLEVRMLGALAISRNGRTLALPASRKARALLAYLALAPRPMARSPLCELLWDLPNDPRGELRWCLSKIRGVFDEGALRRIHTREDTVQLDLSDCFVDAVEIVRATEAGIQTLAPERLRALAALFKGEFLEGLELDRSPVFNGWLTSQRRRFRSCHTALLEHLVKRVSDEEAIECVERWLELAPFDQQAHEILFKALVRRGQIREGEAHLEATIKLFEQEGLDSTPIRNAWRAARSTTVITIHHNNETVVATPSRGRASIAVMPFVDRSTATPARGGTADALAYDVITR
jgi:DNA-binding SARP family transcriptional activator